MKGIIRNNVTGELVPVHSTTDHPDSHWNRLVWVDENNVALLEVGLSIPNPLYTLVEITEITPEERKVEERKRIGRRIAELRTKQGLTVRQLADLCNVAYQNINKIEWGRYCVGYDILQRIAEALGGEIDIVKKQ